MKIELKQCPICGGRPSWDSESNIDSGALTVRCACGAFTRANTNWQAIAAEWNAGLLFSGDEYAANMAQIVIVSRHAGTIQWLQNHGITGDVIAHVTDPAQIAGKIVVGALPLHLAAQAFAVAAIDMPNLPAEKRGQDLTPAEMDEYGARLSVYHVTRG